MLSNGDRQKKEGFYMEMLLYELMRYSEVPCRKQKQIEHSLLCKAKDKCILFSVAAFVLLNGW